MSKTSLFAVTGSPILHSKSPQIWNHAFRKLNIDAHYFRIAVSDISEAIRIAKNIGLKGLNITAPYKEGSLKFANLIDQDVQAIKASNSFIFDRSKVTALNTDWQAIYSILNSNRFNNVDNKKALVLGAGGASRAAIYALKKLKAEIVVSNRTEQKAKKISKLFNIEYKNIKEAMKDEYGVVISCIPYSKHDFSKLKTNLFIDASYSGLKSTANYIAGEEWLILQADFFFRRFFDLDPIPYMKEVLDQKIKAKKHIAITGFMGAGKSSVGKKLAEDLKYDFLDMDEIIASKEGMSIPEIFEQKGVAYFRSLEKDILKRLILQRPTVLATGGGIVLDEENRNYLKNNFNVVWLWANITNIKARVDKSSRPLFDENASSLLGIRTPLYAKTCDICVPNSRATIEKTVNRIKLELTSPYAD